MQGERCGPGGGRVWGGGGATLRVRRRGFFNVTSRG